MDQILSLAASNLLSLIILSFALGVAASLARSDLAVPEAAAKAISIYLLFAIGFKGGVSVADHGIDATARAVPFGGHPSVSCAASDRLCAAQRSHIP